MKLDFTDARNQLSDIEKEYLDYILSGTKLTVQELHAKFGKKQYELLQTNDSIQAIAADKKIEINNKKNIVNRFQAENIVKLYPLAIKTLIETMQNGKEHNKITAALAILKPAITYLEKHGINVANVESEASEKESRAEKIKIVIDADDANL